MSAIAVFLLFIILNVFFFQKVLNIKSHYSLDQFQPKEHPLLTMDHNVRERFKISNSLPYLVLLRSTTGKSWIHGQYMDELSRLTKEIKKIPQVKSILSLANIETALTDESSFNVGRIKDITQNAQQRQQFLKDPLLAPHLISNDGRHTALVIETKTLSFKEQLVFMDKMKTVTSSKPSFYNSEIGGPPAISAQMANLLGSEITLYSALSLFISLTILFAIFRNPSVLVISFVIIVTSNIVAVGLLSYLGISLTVLSSTVPIIVTLTALSMTTQTLSRLADFKDKVLEKHRRLVVFKVMKSLLGSHVIATVTTIMGFATLISSKIPIISDYGISVTISILATAIVCLSLLTFCTLMFPIPIKRKARFSTDSIVEAMLVYRKPLFWGIASLSVCGGILGAYLNWATLLFDDLPKQHPVKVATLSAEKKLGGVIPLEISVGSTTLKEPWKRADNIHKLDRLIKQWRQLPGVGGVISYSDFIKATNHKRQIASKNESIAQTLFIYSMSNNNPLEHFTTLNNQFVRVSLRIKDIPSDQVQLMIQGIVSQLNESFPKMDVETSGLAATVHPINQSLSMDLIYGFYTAMLWIILMLIFVFRSVRWALVSAIPNLVPPALLLGILSLTNTPIKPGIAIIFAISLGIAFNNTVYILGKLKKMTKDLTFRELPIEQLMKEEFAPCLLSSLAVMAGFSVFLFSYFNMNQLFGTFMLLSVVAGLLGDLVLLPTMLSLFPALLLKPIMKETLFTSARLFMLKKQKYIVGSFIVCCVLVYGSITKAATPDAMDILNKVAKAGTTANEQAEIKMKIQEPDGSVRERSLLIKKKQQKAMVKLLSPSDLKGVGLLTVSKQANDEDQWLYLPTEKRSRRITGSNKKGRFLDSELSFEDMSVSTYKNFTNTVLETKKQGDKTIALIESKAKKQSDSTYSKIKTWVDITQYRILKAEYYDEDGELLKIMTFNNYKKYQSSWRAQNVTVKNVKKNRGTTLEIKNISMKKLPDSEFTISALEE